MPWSFLFNDTKHGKNHLHSSSNLIETSLNIDTKEEDSEEHNQHELTIEENDSLLTSLNRICSHWHEIIYNKIRSILTLIFFSMLNIATRLACFSRQRTLVRSTSPLSSAATSSSSRTFEEDINHPSTSLIHFNSQFDLPSLENSTMADMLVQQQTPNIPIHQKTSTQNSNSIPLSHSFDEALSVYNSESKQRIYQILKRMASEPKMSVYQSTSNNSATFTFPNTFLPIDEPKVNDYDCDKFEPVTTETANSDQSDNVLTPTINDELDEDFVLNTNSLSNGERHFRRRKRRSSLTRTSSSSDDTPPIITDPIAKIDDNNNNQDEKSQEISENLQPVLIENLSLDDKKDANLVENGESIDQIPFSKLSRRRRLRYRLNRHTPSEVSEESTSDNIIEPIVPTETIISTPPPSPTSPTVKEPLPDTNTNTLTSKLKRSGSAGTIKKMVRFADTVGRELAQVQYIQSLINDDDSNELSFVKNNLYVPKSYNIEHKPWAFDVVSASKPLSDTRTAKRFFRLYRQPNSEHPDIYLHDIWRSQIKLEHADIHSKSPLTSEQYLHGTLWVTNASYWKNVTVKYTFNRWVNTYEYEAQHRCHSNDFRNIDQFEFSIDIPHDVDRIDFILRYQVNGQEHWDNNDGKNYTLETQSASTPQTTISLPHDCDFNEMRFY